MTFRPIYTPQFKQFVRKNPGIMRKFIDVYKSGAEKYDDSFVAIKRFQPGIGLTMEGLTEKNGLVHHRLWTVEAGERKLFVKETLREERWEDFHFTGRLQYRATHRLSSFAKLLSIVWKHDIEVLEPQFAATFWDTSFIAMDFVPFRQASKSLLPEKLKKQMWLFQRLSELFAGAFDVEEKNAFYDNVRGKLILYDPGKCPHPFPVRALVYFGRAVRRAWRELKKLAKELDFPEECIAPAAEKERLRAGENKKDEKAI